MQGKQIFQQLLFVNVDLHSFVPQDHKLRKIDGVLELSFLRKLTESMYSNENGRPSIDPETYFRMQIIAYMYGIDSDRRLCQEVHLNLAYRWFVRIPLNEEVPDHSSMTRIRDRLGEEIFRKAFEEIVEQCRKAGLVPGRRLIADATLLRENASMNSLKHRPEEDVKPTLPHEERYHDFKTGKKKRTYSNKTHQSSSDPDASLVTQQGSHNKLNYKAHYTIDAKKRIIVDCHVTTGARHEGPVLPDRIGYILERFAFPLKEVLADKGYGRGPTYEYFTKLGVRTYIPLHDERIGQGKLSKGEFIYNSKKDRYRCPRGMHLYPYEKTDRSIKRYRIIGGHCRDCPLQGECLPPKQKHRARFIYRHPQQVEIDKVRWRQVTRTFKDRMRERGWKIEGIFGEAKTQHNLRRAHYRGSSKVQIQAYLTAIVQNLKRMVDNVGSSKNRLKSSQMAYALNFLEQNSNIFWSNTLNLNFLHRLFFTLSCDCAFSTAPRDYYASDSYSHNHSRSYSYILRWLDIINFHA